MTESGTITEVKPGALDVADNAAETPDWMGDVLPPKMQAGATQAARVDGGAVSPGPDGCKPSLEYNQIMAIMGGLSLDPKKLNLNSQLNRFNCQIETPADAVTFAREAVQQMGDPYAQVLNEFEVAAMRKEMEESFEGIGATLTRPKGPDGKPLESGPVVIGRLLDGPARAVGLRRGDLITKVNGEDISNKTLQQIVSVIRGPENTPVTLTIERSGRPEPFDQEVKRGKINPNPVVEQSLPNNVAYIRLETFDRWTSAEATMNAIQKHKNADAYILDLRDNPGGMRDEALQVAALFQGKGVVMNIDSRVLSPVDEPQYERTVFSLTRSNLVETTGGKRTLHPRLPDLVDKPVVVLVNGGSASASEIVTGALRDNKEATVIGTLTFGKGVGQSFFPGPAGSVIKLTHSRTTNPSDHWVGDGDKDRRGIKPDIVVENPADAEFLSEQDAQLRAAQKYLETQIEQARNRRSSWLPRIWPFQ